MLNCLKLFGNAWSKPSLLIPSFLLWLFASFGLDFHLSMAACVAACVWITVRHLINEEFGISVRPKSNNTKSLCLLSVRLYRLLQIWPYNCLDVTGKGWNYEKANKPTFQINPSLQQLWGKKKYKVNRDESHLLSKFQTFKVEMNGNKWLPTDLKCILTAVTWSSDTDPFVSPVRESLSLQYYSDSVAGKMSTENYWELQRF